MKILLTGGSGFVGSHLSNFLTDEGHEVIIIGTQTEQKPKAAKYIGLHLTGLTPKRLASLGTIDACFHQAANNDTLDTDLEEMMFANCEAPERFLTDVALYCKCKKFVYASSSAVYGKSPAPHKEDETPEIPLNAYGQSKLEFDELAMSTAKRHPEISIIGLRYTNVYGPGEEHKGKRASMVYQMTKKMMQNNSPKLFWDGTQRRDWIYIKDVVKANIKALNYSGSGIFNCGSGEATSFNQLLNIINEKLGKNILPCWINCPFPNTYQEHTEADMTKAESTLGFCPEYNIKKGISEMIEKLNQPNRCEGANPT